MVTEVAFSALLAALAAQRLLELRKSRRNEAYLFARGAREHAPEQMPWMQLLHGSWFFAMLLEVWLLGAEVLPMLSTIAFAVFLIGQTLRYAAMHALKERWTVRILTLPAAPPVVEGSYQYLRHPNYLGVILEIAAVPLLHGAWRSAVVFTLANAALLAWRIRVEEAALAEDNAYDERFKKTARLLPRLSRQEP